MRFYQYAESRASQTSPASTGINPVSLKFTANVGDSFLIIGNAQVQHSATTAAMTIDLQDNIDANHFAANQVILPQNTADFYSVGFCGKYLVDSTPNGIDLTLTATPGSLSTVTVKEASIIAFKLDSQDFVLSDSFGAGQISGSTTSTSYTPIASGNLVVATTGVYKFIACGAIYKNSTAANVGIQLTVNGSPYCPMSVRATSATSPNVIPWNAVVDVTLTPGTYAISIDAQVTTLGTAQIFAANCIGLRMDAFPSANYVEDRGAASSTTLTTLQDKISQAWTLNAANYLVIGNSIVSRSTVSGVNHQTTQDGVSVAEGLNVSTVSGSQNAHFAMQRIAFTAASHTFKEQWDRSGGLVLNANISDASLSVFELNADPVVNILGVIIPGANIL